MTKTPLLVRLRSALTRNAKKSARLAPRVTGFGARIGLLEKMPTIVMAIGLAQVAGNVFPLDVTELAVGGLFASVGLLLLIPVRRRKARSAAARSNEWSALRDGDLAHVAPQLEELAQKVAIDVVHQSGPGVALLPVVAPLSMTLTKRFWEELSPGEQRCVLHYVRPAMNSDYLTKQKWQVWLPMMVAIIPGSVILAYRALDPLVIGGAGIILVGFSCYLYFSETRQRWARWLFAARKANAPEAPVLIFKKMLEEAATPRERRVIERLLADYEANCSASIQLASYDNAPPLSQANADLTAPEEASVSSKH